MRSISALGVVALSALLAAGCKDQDSPAGPKVDLSTLVPAGAVQAAIQREDAAADGSVTFVVRVVSNGVDVSAFQGAVTFDAGSMELVSTKTPDAGDDASFVLNSADFSKGRIRFAAFTPTTFDGVGSGDGVEVFRFTVKGGNFDDANIIATMDVVGTEKGEGIAAEKVLASKGVRNRAGHVLSAGQK